MTTDKLDCLPYKWDNTHSANIEIRSDRCMSERTVRDMDC